MDRIWALIQEYAKVLDMRSEYTPPPELQLKELPTREDVELLRVRTQERRQSRSRSPRPKRMPTRRSSDVGVSSTTPGARSSDVGVSSATPGARSSGVGESDATLRAGSSDVRESGATPGAGGSSGVRESGTTPQPAEQTPRPSRGPFRPSVNSEAAAEPDSEAVEVAAVTVEEVALPMPEPPKADPLPPWRAARSTTPTFPPAPPGATLPFVYPVEVEPDTDDALVVILNFHTPRSARLGVWAFGGEEGPGVEKF